MRYPSSPPRREASVGPGVPPSGEGRAANTACGWVQHMTYSAWSWVVVGGPWPCLSHSRISILYFQSRKCVSLQYDGRTSPCAAKYEKSA